LRSGFIGRLFLPGRRFLCLGRFGRMDDDGRRRLGWGRKRWPPAAGDSFDQQKQKAETEDLLHPAHSTLQALDSSLIIDG
jgi:hypothetical protein